MDFKGKVVLITGGAGGIGKALAKTFLKEGSKVSICDINEEEGKRVSQELEKEFGKNKIIFSKCDITKDEDFEGAYNECEKTLGVLDILINNAGILVNDCKKATEVIMYGSIRGTDLALRRMGKHNGGRGGVVVNIASMAGLSPYPLLPYYCAAKAAVIHFSRVLGDSFHKNYSGVSVLCLNPTRVDSGLTINIEKDGVYNQYVKEQIDKSKKSKKSPKEQLNPSEVGEAVIKLINEDKSGEAAVIDKKEGFFYVPLSYERTFNITDSTSIKE